MKIVAVKSGHHGELGDIGDDEGAAEVKKV